MASGGKDIKFGNDKRPVSVVPNNEQFLYNRASGQFLTDEFGNRLVTNVDTFFLSDASMSKATSVAFLDRDDKYPVTVFSQVGTGLTALCGNYEVITPLYGTDARPNVKQVDSTLVGVTTVLTTVDTGDSDVFWYDATAATGLIQDTSSETYTQRDPSLCAKWPVIRTIEEQPGIRNKLYFDQPIGVPATLVNDVSENTYVTYTIQGTSTVVSGTFTNVATVNNSTQAIWNGTETGGTGLTVDIVVDSNGKITQLTINNPGSGYHIGDRIMIAGYHAFVNNALTWINGTGHGGQGGVQRNGNFNIGSLEPVVSLIDGLGIKLSDKLSSDSSTVAVGAASTQYVSIDNKHIPSGTQISEVSHNHRIVLTGNLNIEPSGVGVRRNTLVDIRRPTELTRKSNSIWKVQEKFKETSEVSTTLLGVNRAETQLSLFSNVSSYGLDPDEFETFNWSSSSYSVNEWQTRQNKVYGARYNYKISELTEESGVQIGSYPVPYTYPFGPLWSRLGVYNEDKYNTYKNFIQLGNDLYDLYSHSDYSSYPLEWKDNFLDKNITSISNESNQEGVVVYTAGLERSFAQIDTWTDVWVKLEKGELVNPVSGLTMNFNDIKNVVRNHNDEHGTTFYDTLDLSYAATTLPGYGTGDRHFVQMQSRRVFRYQPGRISGFTFGVKASDESRGGYTNEWGISNPTDEYIFRIRSGQLYIIRRSTIPLGKDLLQQNGLREDAEVVVQDDIGGLRASGDPFREEDEHYVTEISTDYFNGDPLDGRGDSEYNIAASKVTMWKIEFGWYGAIGARFYAYIPAGAGDARWVVVHTLIIENKLKEPCLRDSYFRMIYRVNINNTSTFREPQYVTKYGASYYIDGGDEGTTTLYSGDSNETKVSGLGESSLLALRPKEKISNSMGVEIINKKMAIPTEMNVTAGALTKLSTVVCKGCPGFGYVYTPGVETGIPADGKTISPTGTAGVDRSGIIFNSSSEIQTYGTNASYFTPADIGAKLIAPSINNAYIKTLTGNPTTVDLGYEATGTNNGITEDRYEGAILTGYSPGFDFDNGSPRKIAGPQYPVLDQVTDEYIEIPIGATDANVYPHDIKLSQLKGIAASPYEFSGSKIEIQFLNPQNGDDYGHWADFTIGLSKWRPVLSGGTKLSSTSNDGAAEFTNWTKNNILQTTVEETVGGITRKTSNPPNGEIIFGEHSQIYAYVDALGREVTEAWGPLNPQVRMGLDYRIPTVSNPGGGRCSRLTIETEPAQTQTEVVYVRNGDINANGKPTSDLGGTRQFFVMKNPFVIWPNVTYTSGEVALQETLNDTDPITGLPKKINISQTGFYYVGEPQYYEEADPTTGGLLKFWYLEFTNGNGEPLPNGSSNSIDPTRDDGDELVVAYRPIRAYSGKEFKQLDGVAESNKIVSSRRLYEFNPFPLFLIIKMRDKAAVNGITVKETIGNITKTITPPLYFLKETIDGTEYSRATITNAGGNANRNEASTHFGEIERLCSVELENQNEAKLRSGYKVVDSVYIGENKTKTIDLSDVFGTDRQAIVPDNNNIEATFFIAERIDDINTETNVNMSINFKEQ